MSSSWPPYKRLVDFGQRGLNALTVNIGGGRFPSQRLMLAVSVPCLAYGGCFIDLPAPVERARVRALASYYGMEAGSERPPSSRKT